jgi:hypothetical protein
VFENNMALPFGDLHFPPSFIELLGLCSFQGPQATRLVDKLQELTPQVVPQNSTA